MRAGGGGPRSASPAAPDSSAVLVGGVNSPVRAFRAVGQEPLVLARGKGAVVTDAGGRRFVDFIMGWGALLLGHAHPSVTQAVRRRLTAGWHLGLTHEGEVALAQAIHEAMPSVEQIRFTASGTEACMTAIRLARACTGRSKIVTFEGCYHGHSDGLLVKRSAGVPETIAQETIVAPYADVQTAEAAFRRFPGQIAAVILEPVAANMGVVVPPRQFLQRLRELAAQHGSLLIFDEVVTGFRVAFGGAQARFNVTPDLTVLGKIIGGGFPIGAVGGRRELMRRLAPEGDVYHGGTFAGHPAAMAAGLATIQALQRTRPYARLAELGGQLAGGIRDAARRAGIAVHVNQLGSMLTIFFSDHPVTDFAGAQRADAARFAHAANTLRQDGILVPPSQFEAMFLSVRHTPRMVERAIASVSRALR
ncbi:MAG: glutamate-1-semialdehyde 2,1-aminomutase [Candidatus Omnitrophica bacterium]|nr:glutamate-1-semialdehyde 2,1-aminomutase [Candidatus Omnitrophota bacterium]